MSRYEKTSKRRKIAVGWDPEAKTFFAQVFRRTYKNNVPSFEVDYSCGHASNEIGTFEEFKARLKKHNVRVSAVVMANCEADSFAHDNRPKLPTEWKQVT